MRRQGDNSTVEAADTESSSAFFLPLPEKVAMLTTTCTRPTSACRSKKHIEISIKSVRRPS